MNNQHEPAPDDVDGLVFEQINSLCRSFVEETSAPGAKPAKDRFLDYLQQVDGGAQPTLFRNILHNEIERRRQAG